MHVTPTLRSRRTLDLAPIAAASVAIVLWGSAFPAIRVSLVGYDPQSLAAIRFVLAASVFLAFALVTRMQLPAMRHVLRIVMAGGLGIAAYHLLLNTGELTVGAGPASFIMGTQPVFTALLAGHFLQERLNAWGWIAIAVSFSGVGVIAWAEGGSGMGIGSIYILAAALCQAIQFILQKPLSQHYAPLQLTSYVIIAGSLFLLPFLPRALASFALAEPATLAAIYLALAPGAVAYVCWTYAISVLPIARITISLYLVPIISTLIAVVFLHEHATVFLLMGGLISLAGVILLNSIGRERPPANERAT